MIAPMRYIRVTRWQEKMGLLQVHTAMEPLSGIYVIGYESRIFKW